MEAQQFSNFAVGGVSRNVGKYLKSLPLALTLTTAALVTGCSTTSNMNANEESVISTPNKTGLE